MSEPVLIVGGGLAGLCCARRLAEADVPVQILEASDDVGGRVRTDEIDGFRLDRGFQVFLTAYPEARRTLDYDRLELRPFEPGALIRYQGRFHRMVDPWRRPRHIVSTALSPVASLRDKWKVALLRRRVAKLSLDEIYERPESSTIDMLRRDGFSNRIIERFFRPFLGGVFLERELVTSSRKFEFVFRMFAEGDAALPSEGMHAIPKQLAAALPSGCVRTNTPVMSLTRDAVLLQSGQQLPARAVVVATEAPAAAQLFNEPYDFPSNSVWCLYFAAPQSPLTEPILVLNGESNGPINNLCVASQVAPSYAPPGEALISVTVIDAGSQTEGQIMAPVRRQLTEWFGSSVTSWRHLRSYYIRHALPRQLSLVSAAGTTAQRDGVFLCGDYLDSASIQGAMLSGRRAAERVLETLAS